jgi:hypothetical protein
MARELMGYICTGEGNGVNVTREMQRQGDTIGRPGVAGPGQVEVGRRTQPLSVSAAGQAVLVTGPWFAEMIFRGLSRPTLPGTEVFAEEFSLLPGGAFTLAMALHRLGHDVVWATDFATTLPASRWLRSIPPAPVTALTLASSTLSSPDTIFPAASQPRSPVALLPLPTWVLALRPTWSSCNGGYPASPHRSRSWTSADRFEDSRALFAICVLDSRAGSHELLSRSSDLGIDVKACRDR